LKGFGKTKFGMNLGEVVAASGAGEAANVIHQGDRTIVKTRAVLGNRPYSAFYNITSPGLSTVMLLWERNVSEDACVSEAKKIAESVAAVYGKEDEFSYFEAGGNKFMYSWRFANGARIEVSNVMMKLGSCSIGVDFQTKEDAEAWEQ